MRVNILRHRSLTIDFISGSRERIAFARSTITHIFAVVHSCHEATLPLIDPWRGNFPTRPLTSTLYHHGGRTARSRFTSSWRGRSVGLCCSGGRRPERRMSVCDFTGAWKRREMETRGPFRCAQRPNARRRDGELRGERPVLDCSNAQRILLASEYLPTTADVG